MYCREPRRPMGRTYTYTAEHIPEALIMIPLYNWKDENSSSSDDGDLTNQRSSHSIKEPKL